MAITTNYVDATQKGRTPVRRVMLAGEQLDVTARMLKIERTVNKHDSAELALSSPTLTDTEDMVDKPITFVYGWSPYTQFFYGYVTAAVEEEGSAGSFNFNFQIMGATIVMQVGKPRFWANKSITSVVQDLSYVNYLGFQTTPHPFIWQSLAQTEESDWKMITTLSTRLGYGIFNWDGVVICDNPVEMYYRTGPYARMVSVGDLVEGERRLLEFEPTSDSEQTYEGMGLRFAYLEGGHPQVAEQKGYKHWRFITRLPVRSQEEATVYLAALDQASSAWRQKATARISGDACIYPGLNIEIVTSQRQYKKKYDGKWLVLGVNHQMDPQQYQTQLTLARPDHARPGQTLAFRHFWESDPRGKPSMSLVEGGEVSLPGFPSDEITLSGLESESIGEGGITVARRWSSSWTDRRVRSIM